MELTGFQFDVVSVLLNRPEKVLGKPELLKVIALQTGSDADGFNAAELHALVEAGVLGWEIFADRFYVTERATDAFLAIVEGAPC